MGQSGSGDLTPAALVGLAGTLGLSGSGTLVISNGLLSGTGTLTVSAITPAQTRTRSLSGSGSLARSAVIGVSRAVALSGTGSLSGYLRVLAGEGTLAAAGIRLTSSGAFGLAGEGALAPNGAVVVIVANVDFAAPTTLAVAGQLVIYPLTRLVILDDSVDQVPGVIDISYFEGWPETDVDFAVDGFPVTTLSTDSEGNIFTNSIPAPSWLSAGTHTVTATQASAATSEATFTVLRGGSPLPSTAPADDEPAFVPNSASRWVFQDLRSGGLGSYVLERNPDRWQPPHVERQHEVEHTTSPEGQFHVWGAGQRPMEWSFAGIATSQAMAQHLEAYFALNRRFYVIDHRGRAWVATFVELDLAPRTRRVVDGVLTDWVQDYTVKALAFDQKWVTLP